MIKLKEFLEDSENGVIKIIEEENSVEAIYKVRSKNFIYLYLIQYISEDEFLNINKEGRLLGFYNFSNKSFYFRDSSTKLRSGLYFDFEGISKTMTFDEHKSFFTGLVKKKIVEKIDFNEDNIIFTTEEEVERDMYVKAKLNLRDKRYKAEKFFLRNIEIDKNSIIADYKINRLCELEVNISYKSILDLEKEVEIVCNNYIKNNKIEIYYEILYLKELKKEIEKLKEEKDVLEIKKIVDVFSDKDKKSFKITLLKEGKLYSLNIKKCRFEQLNQYICGSDIIDNDDKKIFFAENDEIKVYLNEITEILYARKVLYKRNCINLEEN